MISFATLDQIRDGTRLVADEGWDCGLKPDQILTVKSDDDGFYIDCFNEGGTSPHVDGKHRLHRYVNSRGWLVGFYLAEELHR